MPTPPDENIWELPPLILHPFNERTPPSVLLDNSKAALMLSGLIPSDGTDPDELSRRLLMGRYGEIRMLFFLGKDVFRWLEQCMDWVTRVPELHGREWRAQSFAALLTRSTPTEVKEKLMRWGVSDYNSIFCRAIGLNTLFTNPPQFDDSGRGVSTQLPPLRRFTLPVLSWIWSSTPRSTPVGSTSPCTPRENTPACSNRSGRKKRIEYG